MDGEKPGPRKKPKPTTSEGPLQFPFHEIGAERLKYLILGRQPAKQRNGAHFSQVFDDKNREQLCRPKRAKERGRYSDDWVGGRATGLIKTKQRAQAPPSSLQLLWSFPQLDHAFLLCRIICLLTNNRPRWNLFQALSMSDLPLS